jgi:hypothetical protein
LVIAALVVAARELGDANVWGTKDGGLKPTLRILFVSVVSDRGIKVFCFFKKASLLRWVIVAREPRYTKCVRMVKDGGLKPTLLW